MRWLRYVVLLTLIGPLSSTASGFDHGPWSELLQQHVLVLQNGEATQVDYAAMAQQRASLQAYLEKVSAVQKNTFDAWEKNEQLAFLLNAYNAWTVELILTRYPKLESIKDLGYLFQSPWKKSFIPLFNTSVSLDHIEHDLIRGSGRYEDPRIHFAVNCASIGCPALRNEAYLGIRLDGQFEEATILFLSDTNRNRAHDGALEVSSIFKWYKEDFTKGWQGAESLHQFLSLYADALQLNEEQKQQLQAGEVTIRFLDYDWALNDKQ